MIVMSGAGWSSERDPAAGAVAVVDVLVDAAAFAQRVDEAAIFGVIADRAERDAARRAGR